MVEPSVYLFIKHLVSVQIKERLRYVYLCSGIEPFPYICFEW